MERLILKLFFLSYLFVSCNNNYEPSEPFYYNTNKYELTDLGKYTYNFKFEVEKDIKLEYTHRCTVRTMNIKNGDNIESITAYRQDKLLVIDITTTPYSFDTNNITAHDVSFNINYLPKGEYKVKVGVNHCCEIVESCVFD